MTVDTGLDKSTRSQLQRAATLIDRALQGADDVAYCTQWAMNHLVIANAAVRCTWQGGGTERCTREPGHEGRHTFPSSHYHD